MTTLPKCCPAAKCSIAWRASSKENTRSMIGWVPDPWVRTVSPGASPAASTYCVAKLRELARNRTEPHEDLPGLGPGNVLIDEVESIKAGEARMTVGTQRSSFLDFPHTSAAGGRIDAAAGTAAASGDCRCWSSYSVVSCW